MRFASLGSSHSMSLRKWNRSVKKVCTEFYTIPNPLFGHHPLLGQSHIVTPYIETQPGLKLGRSVTPAPCTVLREELQQHNYSNLWC